MTPRTVLCILLLAVSTSAQRKTTHETRPALELSNDKAALTVLTTGGAFASFVLKDDARKVNPLWDPVRMSREAGSPQKPGPGTGHFLCVDGFGPTTKEEIAAGLSFHGEANKLHWETVSSSATDVTFRVNLPIVQEVLTRKISLAPGEQVALVESELESQLAFDRLMLWAEHGTVGAPFLKLGKTFVDSSTIDCQTKPFQARNTRTFPSAVNFKWPVFEGQNLRETPAANGSVNHIGCLMDPAREHEFITVWSSEENLLIGYLFPRADYPWVQHWMNYPQNGMYAWGVEFGMQPYDMTKRELLSLHPLFGAPTMRWLPAKSKVATRFLMFLAKTPAGFRGVDDVRLESGRLVIEDKRGGRKIELKSSSKM